MVEDGVTAMTDKEKAELIADSFVKVHSSNNLSEEGKGTDIIKAGYREVLRREVNLGGDENAPFTMDVLRSVDTN